MFTFSDKFYILKHAIQGMTVGNPGALKAPSMKQPSAPKMEQPANRFAGALDPKPKHFDKAFSTGMDVANSVVNSGSGTLVRGPVFGGGSVLSTKVMGGGSGVSKATTSAGQGFLERLAKSKAEGASYTPSLTRPNAATTDLAKAQLSKLPQR